MKYQYAHPEFFQNWESPDLNKWNGKIVLYGAGRRGSVAAHCLSKKKIEFICFCDSDEKKQGKEYCNHKVITPDELAEKYSDMAVFITTNHFYAVAEELYKKGFQHVFSSVSLFLEIDFEGYDMYSEEYAIRNIDQYFYSFIHYDEGISYIPQIQIPVTMRCTLRCKECNSYIPYVREAEDFKEESIVLAVDKLLTAYDRIGNVLLYGGEPLLYPSLDRLVNHFCTNSRIEKITVVTNGTILPNKSLQEEMKSNKVLVRISDYGKLSRKKEELLDLLKEAGIHTEITDFKYWNRNPTVDVLNETEEQLRKKVKNCCALANMITLIKGKIFFCGFSAFYDYFKAVPDFGDNYVDLLRSEVQGEKLRKKIENIRRMGKDGLPKQACRFCKFNNFEDDLLVAEQTNEHFEFKRIY